MGVPHNAGTEVRVRDVGEPWGSCAGVLAESGGGDRGAYRNAARTAIYRQCARPNRLESDVMVLALEVGHRGTPSRPIPATVVGWRR